MCFYVQRSNVPSRSTSLRSVYEQIHPCRQSEDDFKRKIRSCLQNVQNMTACCQTEHNIMHIHYPVPLGCFRPLTALLCHKPIENHVTAEHRSFVQEFAKIPGVSDIKCNTDFKIVYLRHWRRALTPDDDREAEIEVELALYAQKSYKYHGV